jgi:hypothetical protein
MTLVEEARAFAKLTREKQNLQAQLDNINEDLTRREEALLTRFADEGMDSIRVVLGKEKVTLFPRRELWASPVKGQEKHLFTLLRRNRLGDLVKEKVNTQSLSALMREMDKDGKLKVVEGKTVAPGAWAKVVTLSERYRIGTRKAA